MKKLFFALMLLMLVTLVFGQGASLSFGGFYSPPQQVDNTFYDYMNGAYDGYAVRIQNQSISGAYEPFVYMTYQKTPTANPLRKQMVAFMEMNGGGLENYGVNLASTHDGFGTLAIDPGKQGVDGYDEGNVFFVWHVLSSANDQRNQRIHIKSDIFGELLTPWLVQSATTEMLDNNVEYPELHPYLPKPEFCFIWPVVNIGASPINDKRRIYVFMQSSGSSRQGADNATDGYMPSSDVRVYYRDFDRSEIDNTANWTFGVWTEVVVPYLRYIQDYDNSILPRRYNIDTARASCSYAVSPFDGKVAISGSTSQSSRFFDDPAQNFIPTGKDVFHDTFVLYSEDYGNTYRVHTKKYSRVWDNYDTWTYWSDKYTQYIPISNSQFWNPTTERHRFRYKFSTESFNSNNHFNSLFDINGRLHTPTKFIASSIGEEYLNTDDDEVDRGFGEFTAIGLYDRIYDPQLDDCYLVRIFPNPSPEHIDGVTQLVTMPWDLDEDGEVDEDMLTWDRTGSMLEPDELLYFNKAIMPQYHWDYNNQFNNNQIRMNYDGTSVIFMYWVDSSKSYLATEEGWPPVANPEFAEYEYMTELCIVASVDNGQSWSNILRLSNATNPELGKLISFIYPADKLIKISPEMSRVYMMYVDDFYYGTTTQSNDAISDPTPGANIKFMVFDVGHDPALVSNKDNPINKPVAILSQNYPNPFNPSTTISFNLPQASNVNLSVYNIKGQLVKTLVKDHLPAGPQSITWNGDDNNSNKVASGVYFYKIEANGIKEMKKMVLMK